MKRKHVGHSLVESLDPRTLLSTSPVMFDLNLEPIDPANGMIRSLTPMGDAIYFVHGPSSTLWRSEGTGASTVELDGDSNAPLATGVNFLTRGADRLYFASDGDLWTSDGSDSGTRRVYDFMQTTSEYRMIHSVAWAGDQLYMMCWVAVNNTYSHAELWSSDGTAAGTVPVKVDFAIPQQLVVGEMTAHDDALYFVANDGTSGREIWKSDGTLAGTSVVTDFNTASQVSISALTSIGGHLYFKYAGGFETIALTDGTLESTIDLTPPGSLSTPTKFAAAGGSVYFTFNNKVWETQGTAASTMVGNNAVVTSSLIAHEALTYFVASGKLWKLGDAHPTGAIVATLPPGQTEIAFLGDTLLFTTGGPSTTSLSSIDLQTGVIQPITIRALPSTNPTFPSFRAAGNKLYFILNDAESGNELWVSDATTDGTELVQDVYTGNDDSTPGPILPLPGGVAFLAERSDREGREPWLWLDGQAAPVYLGDIYAGSSDSIADEFVQIDGVTYFTVKDSTARHLYRSDGTASGTARVWNSQLATSPAVYSLTVMGDQLYFVARGATIGREIWVTDGTSAGTQALGNLFTGAISTPPSNLIAAGKRLFFSASSSGSSTALWTSDGTAAGTHPVNTSNPLAAGITPTSFTVVGDKVFYVAFTSTTGPELWVSDGTADGTHLVRDLLSGSNSSDLTNLTAYNDKLAFTRGNKLYLTDGSDAGTFSLPLTLNGGVTDMIVFEDTLVFTDSYSLFRNEGTASSTRLLKNFGSNSVTKTSDLVTLNGKIYLLAFDGLNERAIWQSDGSPAGTVPLLDPSPALTSIPNTVEMLGVFGQSLLFSANDGLHGSELWQHELIPTDDSIAPVVETQAFGITNRISVRYTLSEPVNPLTVSLSDLVCENLATSATFQAVALEFSADRRTVEFILANDLPDGDYAFRLAAGSIKDTGGNPTTSDSMLSGADVFMLRGDANGDRVVDFSDLLILAQNYGQSGKTYGTGNFDLDPLGAVTFDDLLLLAQRYGNTLSIAQPDGRLTKKSRPSGMSRFSDVL